MNDKSSSAPPASTPAARRATSAARTATLGLVAAIVVAATGGGIAYWATMANAYIGTVDGHRIAKADYDRAMSARKAQLAAQLGVDADSQQGQELLASAQQQAINSLVMRQVLLDAAASRSLTATSAEVRARLAQIRSQFPDAQSFDRALAQNGFTLDTLRQELRQGVLIGKLRDEVTSAATVSLADAQTYYDQHRDQFTQPAEVEASHILVKTKKEAEAIEAKLKGGANFASLARQYSIDSGSKAQGGDLGFFPRGRMVPAFEAAAFALKPGEISSPVKTQFGYHIIKGGPHKPAHTAAFGAVREQIVSQLLNQRKDAAFQAWAQQQQQQAHVVIRTQFEPILVAPPHSGNPAASGSEKP